MVVGGQIAHERHTRGQRHRLVHVLLEGLEEGGDAAVGDNLGDGVVVDGDAV